MAKRKRHAESGERVDGANLKRAKVEIPASTSGASIKIHAGSDQPSKLSGNERRVPLQASRKHDNARRALKHEGKDKEQSRETVDVPVQSEKAKIDGKDHAGGKEHEAPSPGSRKHNKKLKALKRAEEKEHSGPQVEVPVQEKSDKSDGHAHTEGEVNHQSIPLLGSRKQKKKLKALRRAENKEQSGANVEVTVQKRTDGNDKSDGKEQVEENEHKASLPESRKYKNAKRARKRAEEEEQSELKVEAPVQIKKDDNDKKDGHEQVERNERKASLPGPWKHENERRALKHQAKEEGQSVEKAQVPTQRKERMEPAHPGEVSREPHPGDVALMNGELPDAPASQNVKVKLKKKHGNYFKDQKLARRAMAAAGDTIKKIDTSDQNDAQGPPTILKVDEVQETQQMPVMGRKHKRDKARKPDGKAITITESGKEPAGKNVSEVMERLGGYEVQKPSSKKTELKSSRKKNLGSLEAEGVRPAESEVVEPSGGHNIQQHSSKIKSKSGKKNKVKPLDMPEVEHSVSSEDALEQAVAASYPEWNVARSTGGQMLDTDPIFSKDEEYMLISYPTYVSVYATPTSLLVGTLRIQKGERIAATCLSPFDPQGVYMISKSGLIELWDWSNSKKVESWTLSHDSKFLRLNKRGASNEQVSAYIVHDKPVSQLCVYDLTNTGRVPQDATRPLFTHEDAITSLDVLDNGKQIVMTSGAQVILGTCSDPHPTDLPSLIYDWHIVTCPDWIASIDVRVRPADRDNKGLQKKQGPFQSIDLALGCLRGSIHLYDDLQHKLYQQQHSSNKGQAKDIISRQLHWHRNAVLAVKWSSDGKYVISGGEETVLVIWQLDTGRKDMLPHLGAPIENLVVSPQGSSYAVRLADNSAMILSTAEMRPTFSVAGIQMPTMDISSNPLPALPTVGNAHARPDLISKSPSPASVCPSRPGQLLIAVPPHCASRSSTIMSENASYLQTIDLHSSQQLSRQAIVRTKVTDLNMGPEGNQIEEPDVKHIATSHDGQWLATADEWAPPARDIEPLTFDSEKTHEEQTFRQEVHLKFWSWNQAEEIWELVARIDNPHSSSSGSAYESGRVIALISDPSDVSFVEFGEDGRLNSWRPVSRRRHGSQVKGKDGVALTNWQCSFSTFVVNLNEAGITSTRPAAKLACSPDGSVIALSLQTETASPIYLLDAFDGSIRSVQTGLYSAPLLGLGIIDRHLIIVAYDLVVWDLVDDEEHYRVNLELLDLPHSTLTTHSHLAINLHDKTFALVTPAQSHRAKELAGLKSAIAIFDPFQEKPLFIKTLPRATMSLQPEVGGRGYHAIDSFAEIRAIIPQASLPSPPEETAGLLSQTTHSQGLDQLFGRPSESRLNLLADQPEARDVGDGNGEEGKRPEVKLEQLQEIFNQAPSHELPPVNELFRQVIGLYGRKDGAAVA